MNSDYRFIIRLCVGLVLIAKFPDGRQWEPRATATSIRRVRRMQICGMHSWEAIIPLAHRRRTAFATLILASADRLVLT